MREVNPKIKMYETIIDNAANVDSRPILGYLLSGERVVDRPNSHAHIEGAPLARALSYVDASGRDYLAEEVYMGEEVGTTDCVETKEGDQIVLAFRPHRAGPTRFVIDRKPEPTESISVVLKRDDTDLQQMILISAWAGELSEPEPWDKKATEASKDFWDRHALVWGNQVIDPQRPIIKVN